MPKILSVNQAMIIGLLVAAIIGFFSIEEAIAAGADAELASAQTMISAVMKKAVDWSMVACKGIMATNAFYSLVLLVARDR